MQIVWHRSLLSYCTDKRSLLKIHVIGVFSDNIKDALLGNGKEGKWHKIMYIFSVNYYNRICFILGSLEACP